jgi:hypothetical protein
MGRGGCGEGCETRRKSAPDALPTPPKRYSFSPSDANPKLSRADGSAPLPSTAPRRLELSFPVPAVSVRFSHAPEGKSKLKRSLTSTGWSDVAGR